MPRCVILELRSINISKENVYGSQLGSQDQGFIMETAMSQAHYIATMHDSEGNNVDSEDFGTDNDTGD